MSQGSAIRASEVGGPCARTTDGTGRRAAHSATFFHVVLAMGVLVALGFLPARPASADQAEEIRNEFLRGPPSNWPATFRKIESSPGQIGSVLGPLFRDRSAAARSVSAWTAASLAERTRKGDLPLLADDILRRAANDAPWIEELHADLPSDGNGWQAIVRAASLRSKIASGEPSDRVAAVFVLRFDASRASAMDLAEAWASGPPAVQAAAHEGLEWSLGARFETPDEAKKLFAAYPKESFPGLLRLLSTAKDRPDAPLYRRMVAEARQNLERATTLAELQRYLSTAETPFVEVRRLAAARAARLPADGAGGDAWLPLLVDVLQHEDDRETLAGLVEVARRLKLKGGGRADDLSKAILARLPGSGSSGDLTLGLIDLLTGVADRQSVARAFSVLGDAASPDVKEALLAMAGAVGGNETILCGFHAALSARADETSVRLRTRALDALAEGAKASKDGTVAGNYLRAVIRTDDAIASEAKLPREASPSGRQAAVRALEGFPGPMTSSRLAAVARSPTEDPSLSKLSVLVLGRLAAAADADAGQALVDLAGASAPPAVRIEAVRGLSKLPAEAPEPERARAKAAARLALEPENVPELRVAAADVCSALGDDVAWEGVLQLAVEMAGKDLSLVAALEPALESLVHTLAQSGAAADSRLTPAFQRLLEAGAADVAVTLANASADAGGGRSALQIARARLFRLRSDLAAREPGDRRKDLLDADQILRTVIRAAPAAEQTRPQWGEVLRLRAEVLERLLDDPALEPGLRRTARLAAIEVSAERHDPEAAKEGLALIAAARAVGDLTPEEKTVLEKQEEALKRVSKATPE